MSNIIKLPGLIDTHVHLREPGNTHKEDFETGTKAAIAGGYTMVIDMPNNPNPITNPEALEEKIRLAQGIHLSLPLSSKEREFSANHGGVPSPKGEGQGEGYPQSRIYCDLGFHFGGSKDAVPYFTQIKDKVFGLKVYMNHTTGPLLIEDKDELDLIFSSWPKEKVLMVHAEQETLAKATVLAKKHGNKLHICHVARKIELELIMEAKQEGLPITCEVAMHHLYLTHDAEQALKHYAMMRPPLASPQDQQFLWDNIGSIDIIASDHAPHTREEKESEPVVNGVPGLETSLPLLLNAVNENKLTIEKVIDLTSTKPAKIFNTPEQLNSYVEVDMDEEWEISNDGLYTKCAWTPFAGMKVKGKLKKTVIRGQTVIEDNLIIGGPAGQVTFPK